MARPSIKLLLLVLALLFFAAFIWPWIYTYRRMKAAREVIAAASTIQEVTERLGQFIIVRDPDKIKGLKDRFPFDCSPDDAVYIRSRDGYPYWIILISSSDGIQRENYYIGSLW